MRPAVSFPAPPSRQEHRLRGDVQHDYERRRRVLRPRAGSRHVHRDRVALRLQDRRHREPAPGGGQPGQRQDRARGGRARRDRRSPRRLGADSDADRHGELDAHDRAAQDDPVADAQRPLCGQPAPGRRHDGHRPRVIDQRAPGTDDQHHARRRQREQQPGQGGRRLLRDGPPAARRDRTGDAHHRGAGRRERRPGRRPDPVRDPLGHERLPRHLYDYFRHPSLNTNRGSTEERPRQEPHHPASGRREPGGPNYIPNLFDGRGKAFFFFNYEEFYQPTEATRTRTPQRQRRPGTLYVHGRRPAAHGQHHEVAAATGNTASFDPTGGG